MKTILKTCLAAAALVVIPHTSQAEEKSASFTPDELVPYKTLEDATDQQTPQLHLHLFKPKGWQRSDKRPAIVFFFGGGWVSGNPGQFYPQCAHLANQGMVAISAEYRTRKSHGVKPDACVEDGSDAIAWVHANAEELGIDPKRIAAGGGSAGGHVAATTGTGINSKSNAVRPALMILFNPVLDTSPTGFRGARVLGEKAIEISPLHNVDAEVPPTLIFLGDADALVPVSDAAEFQRQLQNNNSTCELALYAGEPHGFFNSGRRSYPDTLRVMDAFLSNHGFLKRQGPRSF